MQLDALSAFVVDKIDDMKGRDITVIDIEEKASFASQMIICSGNSNRHVKSIADHVVIECRAEGHEPLGLEGNDVGEWSLVDLGDIIVHVMTDEMRDRYQLEQLWS
ncbi:ribosome silencing factor [Thalassotalea sp. LPB0316]|uniref:ribosome silencing factor n=1 Tax=Thalassotalea sp. LPB0316 TaxID=2769490 RepID=UPI001867304D|nr:ribosome silencing factor [Thalassotalea sp. LPB0316]QOL24460.1 ribosome silencing factor [Thalassotalea sp. LPB0316]